MSESTNKAINEMLGNEPNEEVKAEEVKTETEAPASENNQETPAQETSETDWKAEARKWESRAKENKEKADKHDEFSSKVSELEKQINELTTEHKAEIEKNSLEIARWKVAAKYGISAEDVELFLTASDEETLEKQAERLSQTSTHAPKPDAAQGTRNSTGPATTKQQGAAALEGLFN